MIVPELFIMRRILMAKILIVDDDTETTTLLSTIVKSIGHEPISVNQSWHALPTAKSTVPALVLLDIMMSEINGIDLCKFLKTDTELQGIPVVMVSALSDEGSKKDSLNAGAIDFITKPIQVREFAQKIKAILGG
jgi:DNA-binding response OmpR family regulator